MPAGALQLNPYPLASAQDATRMNPVARLEVEVLDQPENPSVLRLPGVDTPALLVRADSFRSWCALADRLLGEVEAQRAADAEASLAAVELADLLHERLAHYEKVLRERRGA